MHLSVENLISYGENEEIVTLSSILVPCNSYRLVRRALSNLPDNYDVTSLLNLFQVFQVILVLEH